MTSSIIMLLLPSVDAVVVDETVALETAPAGNSGSRIPLDGVGRRNNRSMTALGEEPLLLLLRLLVVVVEMA